MSQSWSVESQTIRLLQVLLCRDIISLRIVCKAHLSSLHLTSFKNLQIVEGEFNYMKITVCGEISLFQIDDNSGGMYFSPTQTRLCHSTKHLLYPSWQRVETVLMQPPSCLSQTRGRHFIITRCLTVRLSEVHAPDVTLITSVSFIGLLEQTAL